MTKLIGIILALLITMPCYGLSDGYKVALKREALFLVYVHPPVPYTWGGYKNPVVGLDCSGFLTYISIRAGMPIKRTTAYEMALGLKGWSGKKVNPEEIDEFDVPFFTWSDNPKRIYGHVGIMLEGKNGLVGLVHASSSKKRLVHQPYQGKFVKDTALIRRLSHGDKPTIKLGPGVKQVGPNKLEIAK